MENGKKWNTADLHNVHGLGINKYWYTVKSTFNGSQGDSVFIFQFVIYAFWNV